MKHGDAANRRGLSKNRADFGQFNVQTICFDCAKKNGFTPKNKAFGVWTDRCDVCHETKPCSNLHHDWRKK